MDFTLLWLISSDRQTCIRLLTVGILSSHSVFRTSRDRSADKKQTVCRAQREHGATGSRPAPPPARPQHAWGQAVIDVPSEARPVPFSLF